MHLQKAELVTLRILPKKLRKKVVLTQCIMSFYHWGTLQSPAILLTYGLLRFTRKDEIEHNRIIGTTPKLFNHFPGLILSIQVDHD